MRSAQLRRSVASLIPAATSTTWLASTQICLVSRRAPRCSWIRTSGSRSSWPGRPARTPLCALTRRGIVSGGVVGGMSGGYEELLAGRASDPNYLLGNTRGLIANRISHALHLDGPSMTLDCGQSSSLAAVVMAVRSLRAGDCDVALAGGVNLILTQSSTEAARAFGALSPTSGAVRSMIARTATCAVKVAQCWCFVALQTPSVTEMQS